MAERAAYTVLELAKLVGVSKQTIYRRIEAGKIKSFELAGTRIPASELPRILRGNPLPATESTGDVIQTEHAAS